MDPITIVITALAAGAAAGLNETASQAVRDAYSGLKGLLKRKFGETPGGEAILDRHDSEPEAFGGAVASILEETNAAEDQDVLAAAKRLLELVDPAGSAQGKYNVVVKGGHVGVIGDHGTAYVQTDSPPKPQATSEGG